jgi:hypothetical protein
MEQPFTLCLSQVSQKQHSVFIYVQNVNPILCGHRPTQEAFREDINIMLPGEIDRPHYATHMRPAAMNDVEERLKPVHFCCQCLFAARNAASELVQTSNYSRGKNQIVPAGLSRAKYRKFVGRAIKSRDCAS